MKRTLLLTGFFLLYVFCIAQQDTTALFKRFPSVPPFSLLKSDSGVITKDQLKKNRPVMIMYFSPECHHCQDQMERLIKRMDDFKKVQIVLATYQPMEELVSFENRYQLRRYSNIQAGRDTKFFIVPFYKIHNLPYLALYDKKGNLITTFEGTVKVDSLVAAFR